MTSFGRSFGLPLYPWYGPYFRDLHRAKVINGFSQHVLPRPADWPDNSQVTGYWFFDQTQWTPPEALSRFLAAGPKPVYIGFGSMVSSNARAFTQTVLDAVKKSGQRAVLATGWGALDGDEGPQDEQIFFLRHAPHDGLFPLMSAAVHHGGAGTTAAAVRAGIPSVIVPFFGDQPFWADCLNRQGVAPPALERKSLTADALASRAGGDAAIGDDPDGSGAGTCGTCRGWHRRSPALSARMGSSAAARAGGQCRTVSKDHGMSERTIARISFASDESSLPYAQALQVKEQVMATLLMRETASLTLVAIRADTLPAVREEAL